MDEIEIRQLCANILDGSAAVSDGSAAYDSDPMPIIRELLPWLSSTDGHLRDELVYAVHLDCQSTSDCLGLRYNNHRNFNILDTSQ